MKDINVQDRRGWTPLITALNKGELEKAKELLNDDNINVNLQDGAGWTALITASYYGHTEIVKKLLENKNIDIYIKDGWNQTALKWSTDKHPEIEKLLKNFINKRKTKK